MNYKAINYQFNFKEYILAFDLDQTIIKPKSNKKFPIDKNDWKFIFNSNNKLIEFSKKYSIIIITNQLGITKNKTTIEEIESKIDNIQKELNIPLLVFISTREDKYRKPSIGSYNYILDLYKENKKKFKTFDYIGDAAGRKNDHSDSDLKFLLNIQKFNEKNEIKSKFFTPEEFFENKELEEKNISNYKLNYNGHDDFQDIKNKINKLIINNKYVILVTGYPASGKTTLSNKLSKELKLNYFSKDKDKTKFKNLIKKEVEKGNNFIVEGLYYDNKSKNELLNLLKNNLLKNNLSKNNSVNDYKIINLLIDLDMDTSYHINIYRSLNFNQKLIPKVVYYTFRKNYTLDDRFINFRIKPKLENKDINKFYLY